MIAAPGVHPLRSDRQHDHLRSKVLDRGEVRMTEADAEILDSLHVHLVCADRRRIFVDGRWWIVWTRR